MVQAANWLLAAKGNKTGRHTLSLTVEEPTLTQAERANRATSCCSVQRSQRGNFGGGGRGRGRLKWRAFLAICWHFRDRGDIDHENQRLVVVVVAVAVVVVLAASPKANNTSLNKTPSQCNLNPVPLCSLQARRGTLSGWILDLGQPEASLSSAVGCHCRPSLWLLMAMMKKMMTLAIIVMHSSQPLLLKVLSPGLACHLIEGSGYHSSQWAFLL